MARRRALLQVGFVSAMLIGSVFVLTDARAQQGCCEGGSATGANAWTAGNATAAQWPLDNAAILGMTTGITPPPTNGWDWWTHGELEAGGRGFVNNPNQSGSIFGNTAGAGYAYFGQQSLAKYYEYGIVQPGGFGGGHIAAGTKDGLYQVDLWANNIASNFGIYSDQSYLLSASKAGEQYLTLGWDESPHIYSTSALTPYLGVGTNSLTLPAGAANKAQTFAGLLPFLHQQDIGIQRDTASIGYRWTPAEAWDFNADYSHMDRTGTQVAGIVGLLGPNTGGAGSTSRTSSYAIQVPAPVDDTTQNFGATGEYAGVGPWGDKFTFKTAYSGSVYDDHNANYTVANPFCSPPPAAANCASYGEVPPPAAPGLFASQSPFATISTPPSNQANSIGATLAADLPAQNRFVSTFNYTLMTQNATFQPMTDNPSANVSPWGLNWNQVNFGFRNALGNPTDSLNGWIQTFLSNNVLTTKFTPELTQKLTYRYYNFDNQTPRIIFPCWISVDQTGPAVAPAAGTPCGAQGPPLPAPGGTGSTFESTISSLTMGYIKQNAGYELNWRPSREWNFNGAYGFERYNYTETDYNATNENSGKLSADWNPATWVTVRASGYVADRRYDIHDYNDFVRLIQFPTVSNANGTFTPTTASWFYSPGYQQFMFDNRIQTKANLAVDIVAFRGVTITPTFKYQDDDYGINPNNQEGINYNRQTSTGVDVGWVISPDLSVAVSYYYENYNLNMYNNVSGNGTAAPPWGAGQVVTFDQQHINTVTAAVNYAAIPDKLNFDVRYTISQGTDSQTCLQCTPAYPNDTTLFERLDATATYKFDPAWVHQTGFNGDIKAKLRYTWERNAVNNWQNDSLAPFTPFLNSTTSGFLWLAYDNPNYNVQMLAGSLIASW